MNNLWLTVRRISVTIANLYSRKYFRIASDASSTEMFHQSQKTWLTERNSPRSRWWTIEMIGCYWIDWYLGSRNFEPCFRNRHAKNNRNIFSVLRIGNGRTINWLYIKSLRRSLILKESMVFLEINVSLVVFLALFIRSLQPCASSISPSDWASTWKERHQRRLGASSRIDRQSYVSNNLVFIRDWTS
jgi:hypothetical protein